MTVTHSDHSGRAEDFTSSLREAGHYRIRPYTPKHNGKVERYSRILAEELVYSRECNSEQQRRTAVDAWNVHTINTDRIQYAEDDSPTLTAGSASPTSEPLQLVLLSWVPGLSSNRCFGPRR